MEPQKTKTGVKCIVCKEGEIVKEETDQPITDLMHIPMGPSSIDYYRKIIDYYCDKCGVKYQFPPKS